MAPGNLRAVALPPHNRSQHGRGGRDGDLGQAAVRDVGRGQRHRRSLRRGGPHDEEGFGGEPGEEVGGDDENGSRVTKLDGCARLRKSHSVTLHTVLTGRDDNIHVSSLGMINDYGYYHSPLITSSLLPCRKPLRGS